MDIVSMTTPSSNKPGAGSFVLAAELSWFASFGAAATNTNYGDELRISGNHAFNSGKGFVRLDTEDETLEVMAPVVGGLGSLALKPQVPLYLPGITKSNLLFAQENKSYVLLLPVFGCGAASYLQIGDACNPARLRPADGMKTGKSRSTDQRGVFVMLEGYGTPYIYEGTVTLYP